MLAHTIYGSLTNPKRVAFVHGFTQTRDSWIPLLNNLPDVYQYLTIDAPGHGESSHISGDLHQTADMIVATAGRGVYCGYSMGARMCLHAALSHPSEVTGLVLISGTAGIDDDVERRKRRQSDQQLAQHILDVGVNQFVDEWLSQPMFNSLPKDDGDRALRKTNTASGLANNLIATGTGSQQPLWDRLGELRIPVLIIAGANDLKFTVFAERLHRLISSSQLTSVEGAGHTVHYEQLIAVAALLRDWLITHVAN